MRQRGTNLSGALPAAVIALVLALVSIKIWRGSLSIPFEYNWDSLYSQAFVKSVIEHGHFYTNAYLGAPHGSTLLDFTYGDNLNLLLINILALFSSDPATVMNFFWLLTFPLCAAAAWWAMRSLGVATAPATVAATLFALLPYHYWRGEAHLQLSTYYTVPLAAYLMISVLGGRSLFGRRADSRHGPIRSLATRRTATTLLLCLLIGSSGAYFAFTACVLTGAVTVIALAVPGRRRSVLDGAAITATILAVGLLNLSPTIVYQDRHGTNPAIGQRAPAESEQYALSFTQLVLPVRNHRIDALANMRSNYQGSTVVASEDSQALGLIGTIGLLELLTAVAAFAVGRTLWPKRVELEAGTAALIVFLIATVGGVSSLIAWGLTAQIRGWNRLSVYIGFFALLAVACLLERGSGQLDRFRWRKGLVVALFCVVLAIGLYDQTPAARPGQFDFTYNEALSREDEQFVRQLEAGLPEGAAIFQVPYLPFPEGYPPPGHMSDYDPLRGYLHSEHLKWSYGAMKGRSADIGECLAGAAPRHLLPALASAGFAAIWVDRRGYSAEEGRRLERAIQNVAQAKPLVSKNRRFVVFGLRDVRVDPQQESRMRTALPARGDSLIDCEPLRKALRQPERQRLASS